MVFNKDNSQVGSGYSIDYDGRLSSPALVGNDGNKLPEDWYNLLPTDSKLVIVNETIQ